MGLFMNHRLLQGSGSNVFHPPRLWCQLKNTQQRIGSYRERPNEIHEMDTHTHTHTTPHTHTHTHTHAWDRERLTGCMSCCRHAALITFSRVFPDNVQRTGWVGGGEGERAVQKMMYLYVVLSGKKFDIKNTDIYIQGVPGGMCQTSGECSLGQTIPI